MAGRWKTSESDALSGKLCRHGVQQFWLAKRIALLRCPFPLLSSRVKILGICGLGNHMRNQI